MTGDNVRLLAEAQARHNENTVFPPGEPYRNAKWYVATRHEVDGVQTLHNWRDSFYVWRNNQYTAWVDADVRADLYSTFADVTYESSEGPKSFAPSTRRVNDLLDALRSATLVPTDRQPPVWLGEGAAPFQTHDALTVANGLLDLPSRTLYRHDPRLFAVGGSPVAYGADAPEPTLWLNFLTALWGDDFESIDTLRQFVGYLLSRDMSQQKILLLVGPTRSGKGTVARVLTSLLGEENVAAPTLAGLQTNFGLQALIDKPLAIISDARLSGRADQQVVVERLLSISGEDAITIDRKHRDPWTGRLPTRFLVLTNELPRLVDASGAIANRFIILQLTKSFLGREDQTLTKRLLTELPGILNWALDGLDLLRQVGHFTQPAGAQAAVDEMQALTSPISTFVEDCCTTGVDKTVSVDALYGAFRRWCQAHGWTRVPRVQDFGQDLRAHLPTVAPYRPHEGGKRVRMYQGVALLPDWEAALGDEDRAPSPWYTP